MKRLLHCITALLICVFTANSAQAHWDVGMGGGVPRDSVFSDGMLSLYADYVNPNDGPLTWRSGVDWSYATRPFDGYEPDLTYKAIGARAAALWRFSKDRPSRNGFYVGAGPSVLYYTLKRETPSSGGGSGILFRGTGGISNLWALLLNDLGRNTYTPGKSVSESKTAVGGHTFVGYQGSFWHVEGFYEAAAADLIKPGGLQVRFGFSF